MKFAYSLCFLCISFFAYAQNTNPLNNTLFENDTYFHNYQQEKFFLHTNKITYFSGETIWWKAYVVNDFDNKATTNTFNLYVNLYDANKKLISHQLFYCENGLANGEIELPNSLESGTYYIQLDTQWNLNFKNKYVTAVQVVNPDKTNTSSKSIDPKIEDAINMVFYPESGAMLNNTANTVFFTLKNNKQFIPNQEVEIIDQTTGTKLYKTETNVIGQGKFQLNCVPKHNYIAKINYNNKTQIIPVTLAKNSGIIIHKKEGFSKQENQKFVVEFSEDLLKKHHKKTFFAAIHRNHKLLYVLPFQINKQHSKYVLPIAQENLFNGLNVLTLFNSENQPIAERKFYSETKTQIALQVTSNNITKDSVNIHFKLKDVFTDTNVSISVLPQNTKLNDKAGNIVGAFLLEPYLKTSLPEGEKLNVLDLDIFLQTQKPSVLKHTLPKEKLYFKKEQGLSVKGRVNTQVEENYKVLLSSVESEILEVSEIKSGNSFEFHNLILKDSSNYKLALLDSKGLIVKAGFYVYMQNESYKPDSLLVYNQNVYSKANKKELQSLKEAEVLNLKDTEVLNEVLVEGKNIEEEPIKDVYPNRPNELGNGFAKDLNFGEHEELMYTVIQYLDTQVGIVASETPMGASVIIKRAMLSSFHGPKGALILIDNVPTPAEMLSYMRLSNVKSISINASGAGYGMQGVAGVVSIRLKDGSENNKISTNYNYFNSSTNFGFSTSKPVYQPSPLVFNTFASREFYETLDWIPNFNVLPNQTNTLKVFKGEHEHIKLFVNGLNTHGELLFQVIDVPVKEGL